MSEGKYPHLNVFSLAIGISPEKLVEAFEIEKTFHNRILAESSAERRLKMYEEVYNAVHAIYGKHNIGVDSKQNPKDAIVRLFSKELVNKSVLDVGCGEGHFLQSIAKNLPHRQLVGIDVSRPNLSQTRPEIDFKLGNVISFDLGAQFDVVFSDQVVEHIAPLDLPAHLASVKAALRPGGVLIIMMPNRLFGPSDVTRILDCTYTNMLPAQGTHLNESTYTDLIPILQENGFTDFKTVCFIPKVRNLLRNWRYSPRYLQAIEGVPLLLRLLRSVRLRGRAFLKLDITLICTKW